MLNYMKKKYLTHFRRMIKKRKASRKVKWLTSKMTLETFEREISKSHILRKKFYEFYNKETARGLCYPYQQYDNNYQPVLLEEICVPDVKVEGLFEAPNLLTNFETDSHMSDESRYGDEKRH